jgi:hypothetical protein
MEGLLMRRLAAIPSPGPVLEVLLNPSDDEFHRYLIGCGYDHPLRVSVTSDWSVRDVCARVTDELNAYKWRPEIMWHTLVVVKHQHDEKQCRIKIYGAPLMG